MAPRVSPIFPAEGAFEVDPATPDGRTLPLRSGGLKAVIERRAGYAVTLRFSERSRGFSAFAGNSHASSVENSLVAYAENVGSQFLSLRQKPVRGRPTPSDLS
jgi:hypothetical protein